MSHTARNSAAAAAAAIVVVLGVPATAHAETVDVNYKCVTPIGEKSAVSPIDIEATRSGSGYRIVMSFQKGVSSSPVELGAGSMKPSAKVVLGGAGSGSLTVGGPANAAAVPANTPIKIGDLSGTFVPATSGKVTFTAGVLTISALGTTTTCTPTNNPGPSLTLDVTAASGASPDDGALPQTGPADDALALGALGGTVLLLGTAAALWLTRRRTAAPAPR